VIQTLSIDLTSWYESESSDPAFRDLLGRFPVGDEAALAELIEADGRLRMRWRRPVLLSRYLDAVADLAGKPEALDAAIDMALRSQVRDGRSEQDAVAALVEVHPDLASTIHDAAALNNAVWSTTSLHRQLKRSSPSSPLPRDFGPTLADGQQRYLLRELLGEGAFGEVYLSVDRHLSEAEHSALVSIKILNRAEDSPWARQHLIDEATKARRIEHPGVVRVLDRGVSEEDEDFIVHEFIDGGDLVRWSRQRRRPLPPEAAAELMVRIARGVHAAHMAGLVHCDLKPGNIMMTADGEPKVADFGIATRTADEGAAGADEPDGQPRGNPAFISPEQFRMEPGARTVPSDIYALGGVLFWLLTGTLPNGSTPEAIGRTHDPVGGRREAPSARALCPSVDRDLDAICRRAMAVSPERRHFSAGALADDLEAWLRREPIGWTRPTPARRACLWARRKPGMALALALIALLLVAGAVTGQRMTVAAQQRRLDRARLAAEAKVRRGYHRLVQDFLNSLRSAGRDGIGTELLPKLWCVEWVYGPTILGTGSTGAELWEVRVELIRELIEQARAAGGGDDLDALLWESALAFWLVSDGEHEESEPMLAALKERWVRLLEPEDPWLHQIEALRICAAISRLEDLPEPARLALPAQQEIRQLAAAIDPVTATLQRRHPDAPVLSLLQDRAARLPHLATPDSGD
jgi:hypothetical protein